MNACELAGHNSRGLLCSFLPLRGLSHVSDKVLLPHYKIDDPSKGGRSFKQMRETHRVLYITSMWFCYTLCKSVWICLSILVFLQLREVLIIEHTGIFPIIVAHHVLSSTSCKLFSYVNLVIHELNVQ